MRIAMVVRWIGYLLGAGVVVLGFLIHRGLDVQAVILTFAVAAFFVVAGWTLAWIIEGFAKPKA